VGLSDAQKALRRTGTGSSEIATVAGEGWGSILDVWANKVHGLEKEATLAMQLGALVEDPICDLYARKTGKLISRKAGAGPERRGESMTLVCEDKPIILATPDRFVHHRPPQKIRAGRPDWDSVERGLEAKHASMRARTMVEALDGRPLWGAPGTDEVPLEYLIQGTWFMRATGPRVDQPRIRTVDYPVLFDKDAYEIYTVTYDVELAGTLEEVNDRFWADYVLTRKEPPPDTSDRYREMLLRLHPTNITGTSYLDTPPELAAAAVVLRELKHAAKLLEERIKLIEDALCQHIGDHAGTMGAYGTITWKLEAGKPAYKAVAEALREELRQHAGDAAAKRYADLVAEHTKPHRVLRKSWTKMGLPELPARPQVPARCALERELAPAPDAYPEEAAAEELDELVVHTRGTETERS
jgi:predicted phage-related endonuclease